MIEHLQQQLVIPREHHYQRIDGVLAQLMPEYSRSQIGQWIKTGGVQLNQKACKPKDKVSGGDVVSINVDFTAMMDANFSLSKPEAIALDIIYEDDELLVINKPAGLVVHPGAGNREHTLVNALLHHNADLHYMPRAGIVHRLDKDTTGLLMVAKTLTAHNSLVKQLQDRDIKRHYLALVQGYVVSGGTIDTGYGRHTKNRLKMSVLEHGRQAITHYSVCERYQQFSLLDVHLMTGRTHQIRVHMAYLNHPIIGDQLYGGRARMPAKISATIKTALQQFKRQALHARTITFMHPKTKEELTFEAPIPEDFQSLITLLDTDNDYETC